MRTIKFRGKRCFSGKWRIGNLLCEENFSRSVFIKDYDGYKVRVDPKTVGQFTGLHDINGTEIYEGDVIEGDESRHRVVYFEEYGCFMAAYDLEFIKPMHGPMSTKWIKEHKLRVIGNIHDNPELLSNSK